VVLGVTILCVFDHVVHARQKLHFVNFVNQVTYYVLKSRVIAIEVSA